VINIGDDSDPSGLQGAVAIDAGAGNDTINVIATPANNPVIVQNTAGVETVNVNADGTRRRCRPVPLDDDKRLRR
jgi:hypothetical protein